MADGMNIYTRRQRKIDGFMTYRRKDNIGDFWVRRQNRQQVLPQFIFGENDALQQLTVVEDSSFGTRISDIDSQQHKPRFEPQSYK